MPSPLDYFTPAQVQTNKYIIEEKTDRIFAPDSNGRCWSVENIIVFANERICVYWQKNNNPVKYKEILLSLDWLGKYVLYGGYIMDYGPSEFKTHTGRDGITRAWVVEANTELCSGYGGAAYNGKSWCAISQDNLLKLINTVYESKPTIPQVIFYEMGRCLYNLKLDKVLDWQMENPDQYGYWTLGFTGAMTAIMPDLINCKMDYYGTDAAGFRAARINDLNTYVGNSNYTFQNTWSAYLLPWTTNQSVNDLMSGLLIYLSENYGSAQFLYKMFFYLCQQRDDYTRTQREQKASNLVRSCYLAVRDLSGETQAVKIHRYFYSTLRWSFVGRRPNTLLANQ